MSPRGLLDKWSFPFGISTVQFSGPFPLEVPFPRGGTFPPTIDIWPPTAVASELPSIWMGVFVGGSLGGWPLGLGTRRWLVVAFGPLPLPLPPALVHRHSSTSALKLEMFCVWLPAGLGRSSTRRTRILLGATRSQEERHHRQEPSRRHSFMPFGQLLAMGLR